MCLLQCLLQFLQQCTLGFFSNDHETGRCPSIAKDDICRQNPRFKFIRYHVTVPHDGSNRIFCVQYSEFPDSKPLSYQKTLFPWDAVVISLLNALHPRWRHLVALTRVNILDRRLGTLWLWIAHCDDHDDLQLQSLVREFPRAFSFEISMRYSLTHLGPKIPLRYSLRPPIRNMTFVLWRYSIWGEADCIGHSFEFIRIVHLLTSANHRRCESIFLEI